MPIEFHCRICHAMIRVPDNAGGGKGRCPKCGLRITVPKKSAQKPPAKSSVPDEPFSLPIAVEENADDSEPVMLVEAHVELPPVPVALDSEQLAPQPPGLFPLEPASVPKPSKSAARRLKQRKLRTRIQIVVATLVLVALVVAACFLIPILTAERLTGELVATTAETLELPPTLIEKARIKISSEELAGLLKKLENAPLPMTSSSMQVQFTGSPKGILVSVAAGSAARFYRVDLKANEAIKKYLDINRTALDEQRTKEVNRNIAEFLLAYQDVLAKKSTSDQISVFRDSLAIPSLVKGFGHQLVAAYGRGLYRCVYEDGDGALYFLLPAGATEFELRGREGADGRIVVPAEFKVRVTGNK